MMYTLMIFILGMFMGFMFPYILGTVMSIYRIFRFAFRGLSKISWKYKHKQFWADFKWALDWELKGAEVQ